MVFEPARLFQPSLMFLGKAKSFLHSSGAPKGCFTQVGSGFAHKHCIRLERPAKDKPFSLLQTSKFYRRKKVLKHWHQGPMLKFLRPNFTNFRNKLVFIPGKLFQPSLIFAGKFSSWSPRKVLHSSKLRAYSQALDIARKSCLIRTL